MHLAPLIVVLPAVFTALCRWLFGRMFRYDPGPAAEVMALNEREAIAARDGTPISFWQFTKYGLVVTPVLVALATPYLWLRYLS
ncbi:hypothetical protein [Nonomuraea sp. MG754425]|uniref:hypothetical protein n=1 Tax=Nonomuraea sp. MG754425 TaxID=2570319 RepID=UPI001F3D09E2|nr:hypothetical protein [Nonomuraea sp. MG754425]